MIVPLHFADSSSGIGALGVNFQSFVIQLITFLIAFLVLRKWAFGPILRALNERRKTIEEGVKLGEDMRKEKAELEAKIEKMLHEARQEADGIIAGAQDSGRSAVREAEDKARKKAEGIVAEARQNIVQETNRARQQMEKEMVNLVAEATEAIIGEKVDAKKDAQLIERMLKGKAA